MIMVFRFDCPSVSLGVSTSPCSQAMRTGPPASWNVSEAGRRNCKSLTCAARKNIPLKTYKKGARGHFGHSNLVCVPQRDALSIFKNAALVFLVGVINRLPSPHSLI